LVKVDGSAGGITQLAVVPTSHAPEGTPPARPFQVRLARAVIKMSIELAAVLFTNSAVTPVGSVPSV